MSFSRLTSAFENLLDRITPKTTGTPLMEVLDSELTNNSRGIRPSQLQTLAQATFDPIDYQLLKTRLWVEVWNNQASSVILKKTLMMIEYLLIHGHPRFIYDCQTKEFEDHMAELARNYNRIETERYVFGEGTDIGAGVRKEARRVLDLLIDEQFRQSEKHKAEKIKSKFTKDPIFYKGPPQVPEDDTCVPEPDDLEPQSAHLAEAFPQKFTPNDIHKSIGIRRRRSRAADDNNDELIRSSNQDTNDIPARRNSRSGSRVAYV